MLPSSETDLDTDEEKNLSLILARFNLFKTENGWLVDISELTEAGTDFVSTIVLGGVRVAAKTVEKESDCIRYTVTITDKIRLNFLRRSCMKFYVISIVKKITKYTGF